MAVTWWQAWGQGAVAISGLALAAVSLALGIYNALQARQRHGWAKTDRDREEARRQWCEEERRKLVERIGNSHPVPPDKSEWALWGEQNGYFRRYPGGPGSMVLVLAGPKQS